MLNLFSFSLVATSREPVCKLLKSGGDLCSLTQSVSLNLLVILINLTFELNLKRISDASPSLLCSFLCGAIKLKCHLKLMEFLFLRAFSQLEISFVLFKCLLHHVFKCFWWRVTCLNIRAAIKEKRVASQSFRPLKVRHSGSLIVTSGLRCLV